MIWLREAALKVARRERLIAFMIIASCSLAYWHPMFTNSGTPGGDGARIFPYLEFVDSQEAFYPLWNPYKVGGVPTLADPERFVWLAKLVDTDSPYANLCLNGVLLLVAVLLLFTTYLLGRQLSISHLGAILAALVFGYS